MNYVLKSKVETEDTQPLYWNNECGWTLLGFATTYSKDETLFYEKSAQVMNAEWVPLE